MSIRIEVSKEAADQVRNLMREQKPGTGVRVYFQGAGAGCGCGASGCGGGAPAFGMAFDRPRPGDEVIPVDGFNLLVDELSAEYLDGGRIDFVQELSNSGFQVTSPKSSPAPSDPAEGATAGCGCGCGSGGCC